MIDNVPCHPGQNYYKRIPWNILFVIVLVRTNYYKIIPPEYFLCNFAATGLSLFAREGGSVAEIESLDASVFRGYRVHTKGVMQQHVF